MRAQDRWRISLLLMLASGFAGLGYQIVWTQQCALWLGHEAAGVLAVVAAFFGGLAVGASLLGARIERSAWPLRWYAACEILIALWSLLLAIGMGPVSAWLLDVIGAQPAPGRQWTVAFLGTFLLLLPATAAMGATLPAMVRAATGWRDSDRSIAPLYASNTGGAVVGVLACAFWLVPEVGLTRTAAVCAALNLFCAAMALVLSARIAPQVRAAIEVRDTASQRGILLRLGATGLLGIGYEVLVVRVLSQVEEDTVYTFAMLLAVYLVGSALGAVAYQRWLVRRYDERRSDDRRTSDRLLLALAATCLVGMATLWADEYLKALILHVFGAGMPAAIAAEAVLAVFAFGPPTLVMGALFSHLGDRAVAAGIGLGRALAANTLGAACAPLVFGVVALPLAGAKLALLLVVCGYLALIPWRAWSDNTAWLPAGLVVALAVFAPPLAFVEIPDGGHIVSYREGALAAVSVVEDAEGVSRLRIDNRQQEGSSASLRVDARQALLPVLLHSDPHHVLMLGLGTGVTASAAALDPELEVDAVELLPEVIAASDHFTRELLDDAARRRLHLLASDARRYVRASERHYDVIVADNFHPARSGSGSLYTVEHFDAVRARLAPHGIFCQWLPLHQLDLDTLRSIVQSFSAVYPEGWALLASNSLETPVLGLVGRFDAAHFDSAALGQHMAASALPEKLADLGLEDEYAVLGGFVAGPRALHRFAASAALNTDDHPVVAYRAPRITYAPDSLPRERLEQLLGELSIEPGELLKAAPATEHRLAAYWQARDRFIEAGRAVRPAANAQDMLAQVREPLLAVLRISPDFRPAYDPLLLMGASLARTDPAAARSLLAAMVEVQPARAEAAAVLAGMGP